MANPSKAGKTRIQMPGRSEGDGMENTSPFPEYENNNWISNHHHSTFTSPHNRTFVPPPGKFKGPKFVPYEPYKAAVSPITAAPRHKESDDPKFVIDSQKVSSLASSIIEMYSNLENKEGPLNFAKNLEDQKCRLDCRDKIQVLEDKIKALEKEKKELTSQHQVQIEVNADLKKMLVASLGEDVQCKVQYMTEDKAHLGKQVLQLSEQIDQIKEEMDKLSVQCNVWESKFKASGLMVKELAQWKASLSHKLNDSVAALDSVLKEHDMLFEQLYATHCILEQTLDAFDPSAKHTPKKQNSSLNILKLATELTSLSNNIQERLLGKLYCDKKCQSAFDGVRLLTRAENLINQFFNSFHTMPPANDVLSKDAEFDPGMIACKVLPHICMNNTSVSFCKHCSGEIKTV